MKYRAEHAVVVCIMGGNGCRFAATVEVAKRLALAGRRTLLINTDLSETQFGSHVP